MYIGIKHTHLLLVVLSVVLFEIRFWGFALRQKPKNKFLIIMPHVIDTLLLASGVTLAVMAGFSLTSSPWLLFKLLALVGYIGFGVVAMKVRGGIRWIGFCASTLCLIYMVMVALTKNPTFFL